MSDDENLSPEDIDAYVESIVMLRRLRLRRNSATEVRRARAQRASFTRQLRRPWGDALDAYFFAITHVRDFGRELAVDLHEELGPSEPYLVDVLARLHAQACLVACEVWALLSSGFGQGALARWRTMHEIATTMLFIQKHGEETALRFWIHGAIERSKLAQLLPKGMEPFSAEVMQGINDDRNSAIARWGRDFAEPNGWAGRELQKARPAFRDIEDSLGDLLPPDTRWIYKWASNYVHPQALGASISLGLPAGQRGLLAGPSTLGIDWPGHAATISLQQSTVALASLNLTIEREIRLKVVSHLLNEASSAFNNDPQENLSIPVAR